MKVDRERSWIQTYTGKKFYPLEPRAEDIDLIDIAHALSMQCRFTGHVKRIYTVGEHCVRATNIHFEIFGNGEKVSKETLWMLLHDAAEAYLIDLAKPVKVNMPFYCEAEEKIMAEVCKKFDLDSVMPESVKKIDQLMLAIEARDLMGPLLPGWEAWDTGILTDPKLKEQYEKTKIPMTTEYNHLLYLNHQDKIKNQFLKMFNILTHNWKELV